MTIRKKLTNLNKRSNSVGKLYRLFEEDIWGYFFFKNVNFAYRYKFLLKSCNLSYRNMHEIWELIKQRKLWWLRKRKFDKLKKAIFRLDVIRVFKKRPRRTKVSVAALDARKFKALYNIPIGQIRALIHSSFDGVLGSKYTRFLINLESRLDVAIFRLHFVDTVGQARQLINHGKITVNGQVLNKQSYKLARNDIISCVFDLRPFILSNILRRMLPFIRSEYYYYYPIYYEVNYRILSAKVVHVSKPFKDTWIPFFSKKGVEYVRNAYAFFAYRKRFF